MRRISVVASFAASALFSTFAAGCYHYTHELHPAANESHVVTHSERVPTYLNGFVGNGEVDARKYCEQPVRTELRVTATDVLLSVGTLLIYTPHTLYVTCDAPVRTGAARSVGRHR
jgi:hypothetical protein